MFNLAEFACRHYFDVRFSLIADTGLRVSLLCARSGLFDSCQQDDISAE